MKHVFSFLLLLASAPLLHGEGMLGVATADGATIWAVGPAGRVLRSADGGVTWGSQVLDSVTLRGAVVTGSLVLAAGDGGRLHRSTDWGTGWSAVVLNGGLPLHALCVAPGSVIWAAGEGGGLLSSADGGATWTPRVSGTAQTLTSLWFSDSLTGYAAGAAGTLRRTADGGATWSDAAGAGWTSDLSAVRGAGGAVLVTGTGGFAAKSTTGGLTWSLLPFTTDSRADVTALHVFTADSAVFALGGGSLWTTGNGGAGFTWGRHQLHGSVHDVVFHDPQHGWAVSGLTDAVLRTSDGGATWLLPAGTTVTYSWSRRLVENSSIGNTFVIAPWNPRHVYVAMGDSIYRSTDRGETWTYRSRITSGPGATHSFYISPKDSNLWVVAHTGGGDAIKRSTNGGATWTVTLARNFTSYGMPLEMDPAHPDTLLFAPDGTGSGGSDANGILYRSTDFGLTWDTLAATSFRSPCDVVIVPDSSSLVYVGDGITGSGRGKFWRSEDAGETWKLVDSVSGSEIPTVTMSRLRRNEAVHTSWGSGGVRKTTDFASSFTQIATTSSAWGVDVAKDDPEVIMFGVYGGGITYLSTNGGSSFPAGQQASLTGSNYAILAYDRATFLAQQSGGVYKLRVAYSVPLSTVQTLAMLAPNGGESWAYGSVHPITWTAGNITAVKLEYAVAPGGPWQTITPSTPAGAGSFAWMIPDAATTQARVRVSDAGDSSPVDSSDAPFTITVPALAMLPGTLDFDTVQAGGTRTDTVRITNTGTGPLVITSVTGGSGVFTPGRTSFTVPAGGSDTLSVRFAPVASGLVLDTLLIRNTSPAGTVSLPVSGVGVVTGPMTVGIPMEAGWNMVSLPVLPADVRTATVFPQAASGAFGYSGTAGYMPEDSLEAGPGYWLKFDSTLTAAVTGMPVTAETVQVAAGWNMVGAIAAPVDTAQIIQAPPGIIVSSYFGYGAGYTGASVLEPGKGYWVKAAAEGVLILQTGVVQRPTGLKMEDGRLKIEE